MAAYDQPKNTYSDTGPDIRVISEVVNILTPNDAPLIAALGGLDGARSKFNLHEDGTKIEALEDDLDAITTTVSNGTVALTTNTVSFGVADASLFRAGHQIKIDSEYMVVSAANVTNDTITVFSRSYGGTNATHATNAAISIVGMARLEGADAAYSALSQLVIPYNYTAIFKDGLQVTGTQQAVPQYGIKDQFEYQAIKKLPRLTQLIELAIYNGIRAVGSATTPRSFGGLGTFITDNYTTTTGKVNKTMIDDLAESIHIDGGNPDLFVCAPGTSRDLRDILDTSSFVTLDQMETVFGMMPISRIRTSWNGAGLAIIESRLCPSSMAWMLDSKKIGLYTLRPFGWYDLAKTGDTKKGEVVGEFSLLVVNDKAHGYMSGIST